MAKRWRGSLNEKVKLVETSWGWQLEQGEDVVVWASEDDALMIPPAVKAKGAGDLQFPEGDSQNFSIDTRLL